MVLCKATHGNSILFTDHATADVPGEEGRTGSTGVEASVGSLKDVMLYYLLETSGREKLGKRL